eukprot:Blabericola_migrator_1__3953@NODE_219_length_11213_cov_124_951821_g186_i0_p1_GENE_NODE_219_length_11213_cov_124_951821_g186_i0NODE_219_length_11213_cov_124_951821_g186_i0_p1_ORF_typecomplete_len758_score125_08_NODE_219_length_11213_cov_124_951821_g186_i0795810231
MPRHEVVVSHPNDEEGDAEEDDYPSLRHRPLLFVSCILFHIALLGFVTQAVIPAQRDSLQILGSQCKPATEYKAGAPLLDIPVQHEKPDMGTWLTNERRLQAIEDDALSGEEMLPESTEIADTFRVYSTTEDSTDFTEDFTDSTSTEALTDLEVDTTAPLTGEAETTPLFTKKEKDVLAPRPTVDDNPGLYKRLSQIDERLREVFKLPFSLLGRKNDTDSDEPPANDATDVSPSSQVEDRVSPSEEQKDETSPPEQIEDRVSSDIAPEELEPAELEGRLQFPSWQIEDRMGLDISIGGDASLPLLPALQIKDHVELDLSKQGPSLSVGANASFPLLPPIQIEDRIDLGISKQNASLSIEADASLPLVQIEDRLDLTVKRSGSESTQPEEEVATKPGAEQKPGEASVQEESETVVTEPTSDTTTRHPSHFLPNFRLDGNFNFSAPHIDDRLSVDFDRHNGTKGSLEVNSTLLLPLAQIEDRVDLNITRENRTAEIDIEGRLELDINHQNHTFGIEAEGDLELEISLQRGPEAERVVPVSHGSLTNDPEFYVPPDADGRVVYDGTQPIREIPPLPHRDLQQQTWLSRLAFLDPSRGIRKRPISIEISPDLIYCPEVTHIQAKVTTMIHAGGAISFFTFGYLASLFFTLGLIMDFVQLTLRKEWDDNNDPLSPMSSPMYPNVFIFVPSLTSIILKLLVTVLPLIRPLEYVKNDILRHVSLIDFAGLNQRFAVGCLLVFIVTLSMEIEAVKTGFFNATNHN